MFDRRLWVGQAAMPGPEHYRRRINRQDQVFVIRFGKWIIGAVADGCSQSKMSEAGAADMVNAAVQALYKLVSTGMPFEQMPKYYEKMMETFLFQKVMAMPAGPDFLKYRHMNNGQVDMSIPENYLVYKWIDDTFPATTLSCCIHEDNGGIVIVRGDGVIHLDGELTTFNYNDCPPYFAYHLAIANQGYEGNPEDLRCRVIRVPAGFATLAMTSDGWPWQEAEAYPFKRWRYSSFLRWLADENKERVDKGKSEISPEHGWLLYQPQEVNDLARKLVKSAVKDGEALFTDDISGIFIESEVISIDSGKG